MSEKVVRKKSPKKTTAKTATKKAVVKRTAARKSTNKTAVSRSANQVRKAPTNVAETKENMVYTRNLIIGASLTLTVFLLVSIFIGFSDGGEIVVSQQVEKRLETASSEERQAIESVSKPIPKNDLPLGGLVGIGDSGETSQPASEPMTDNGDDASASSTPSADAATEDAITDNPEVLEDEPVTEPDPTAEEGV